jgi:membrane protease YdiL (CAAX protease family)
MNMSTLKWMNQYDAAAVVLITVMILYPFSYYAPRIFPLLLKRAGASQRTKAVWSVLLYRFFGVLVLGGGSAVVAAVFLPPSPNRFGVNVNNLFTSLMFSLSAWVLVGGLLYLGYLVWPASLKGYPEINVQRWDLSLLAINTLSWVMYLAAYEYFFRGFLLYPLTERFGSWPAILITTGLFSFSHLTKEPQEQAAAIPIGVFYGLTALLTGSILGPFLVHSFIAPTTDVLAILSNPDMKIYKSWRLLPDAK